MITNVLNQFITADTMGGTGNAIGDERLVVDIAQNNVSSEVNVDT